MQNIRFYDAPYDEYEGEEITEALIAKILGRIPNGLNIYLSLDLYGEDDWLEVKGAEYVRPAISLLSIYRLLASSPNSFIYLAGAELLL